MRLLPFHALVVLVCGLSLAPRARADDPPPAPTLTLEGESVDAEGLRQRKAAVEADIAALKAAPPGTPEALQAALEPMTALAAALETAAAYLDEVAALPPTKTRLSAETDAAKAEVARLQQAVARPAAPGLVDGEAIQRIEAEVAQANADVQAAAGSVQALDAGIKSRRAEFDALPARVADLDQRIAAVQAGLDAVPADALDQRKALERRRTTLQVQRSLAILRQAKEVSVLEVEALRRGKAEAQKRVAELRRQIAEANLVAARAVRQAQLEEEARRKAEETERALREAELARSPAVKAVKRLEALRGQMEAAEKAGEKHLSELKTIRDEAASLAEVARARLASIELLYPEDADLEAWQHEGISEQALVLEEDEREIQSFERTQMPVVNALLAEVVTESGRLGVFDHRVERASARLEARSPDEHIGVLEQTLATTQDETYRLWLQARLDFARGRSELRPDEVERLRGQWQAESTNLRDILNRRADDLTETQKIAEDLRASLSAAQASLVHRRRFLSSITFWLRSPPLFSRENLEGVLKEAEDAWARLRGAPAYLERIPGRMASSSAAKDAATHLAAWVLGGVLLALILRRRLRRLPLLERPIAALDALGRAQRAAAVILGAVVVPGALLGAALAVRGRVPEGEGASLAALAVAILLFGVGLTRGVVRALFTPDAEGRCVAQCSADTARRSRAILRVLLLGSATLGALLIVFHQGLHARLARFTVFAWGALGVLVGFWLVVRRDVLRALIPAGEGRLFARTVRGALLVLWPVVALFFGADLVLDALGYQRASAYLLTRVLSLALALLVIGTLSALLRAVLDRRLGLTGRKEEDGEYDVQIGRAELAARALRALITVGTVALVVVAVNLVFGLRAEAWRSVGDVSLTGDGAGKGLTLWRLAKATIILVVSVGLARFVRSLTRNLLRSRGVLQEGSRYAIRTLLFYAIVSVGILSALSTLGLDMGQLGWFLTAAGVGIGFGLQEIINNFISGLILFFERPVQVGDVISVGQIEGNVQQINIRSTVVRTRDGMSIILPNKALITDNVVNWSHGDQRTRLQIQIGVAYGSDVALVKKILLGLAAEDTRILQRPAPEVEFRAFGESELQFVLYVWLPTPDITLRRHVRSQMNTRIDEQFAAHGVRIPFPQRDVHIHTDAPGSA